MKKVYLVLGSNNFYYSYGTSKREAISVAKEVLTEEGNAGYADPESGHEPDVPSMTYVYEAKHVGEYFPKEDKEDEA